MGNQNSKTWDVHQAETHLQDRAVVVVLAQSRVVAHPAAEAHHDAALPAIPVEGVACRYPRRALRTTACIRAGGVLVLDITCPLPRVQEEHKHRGKKEN